MERRLFESLAFAARYGRQPMSDMVGWPRSRFYQFLRALETVMRSERGPSGLTEDG